MIKNINNSLSARSIIMLFFILFSILGIMTVMNISNQNRIMLTHSVNEGSTFSNVILTAMRHPMLGGDQDIIQLQFDNYRNLKEVNDIHLTDYLGVIKRSTDKSRIGEKPQVKYLDRLLRGEEIQGVEIRKKTGESVFAKSIPIFNEKNCFGCHGRDKKVLGVLRIVLDWKDKLAEEKATWKRNIYLSLVGLMVIIILTFFFLLQAIIRPIKDLGKGMNLVAHGDFSHKIIPKKEDEIGRLIGLFNKMSDDLRLAIEKEQKLVAIEQQKTAELGRLNRVLLQEITSRKRAEEGLQSSNRKLLDIIEFLPDATFVIDQEKKVIAWNRALEDMTGVSKKDMIGKGDYAYAVPFYGQARPVMIDFVFQHNSKLSKKYDFIEKKGNNLFAETFIPGFYQGKGAYLWVVAAPLFDDMGHFIGAIESIRDITGRKKAEARLKEVMETKSKFTSIVSHELRTPLTAIKEGINIVLDGSAGQVNPEQKDFLDTAKRNVDRLARLINDVLDFQKLEAGKAQFDFRDNDINEVVLEIERTMSALIKNKGLDLAVNLDENLPVFRFDRDKIIQVMTNLVNNAIKFTEKGSIILATTKKGNAVCVTVEDTGPGVKQEDIPRLFQSFEQLGDVKDRKGGTGLGLAISKEIIEKHGGDIYVESAVGAGTKFIFTLPRYGIEKILEESIKKGKEAIEKADFVFGLFVLRWDNYRQIKSRAGSDKTEAICRELQESLKGQVGVSDLVIRRIENELFVSSLISRPEAPGLKLRLRAAVKETIFRIDEELKAQFSSSYVIFPDEAKSAEELLDKAYRSVVNTQEEKSRNRIMLVDDEPDILSTLRKILEKFGYSNIREAAGGEEALAKIETELPDLIILDIKMPKMSGYEVIGRLKGNVRTKDIPLLIISGYEIKIDRIKEYIKKEALPMIGKPFDIKLLEKWLNYLL
ncbi:MAG: ATP-binding protein [Candidatus Omnitrophica bacterium]|nr:ATP-binding protein [Candidatus Omnitrophota bacterium]